MVGAVVQRKIAVFRENPWLALPENLTRQGVKYVYVCQEANEKNKYHESFVEEELATRRLHLNTKANWSTTSTIAA